MSYDDPRLQAVEALTPVLNAFDGDPGMLLQCAAALVECAAVDCGSDAVAEAERIAKAIDDLYRRV